jgi:hypothetical protein
MKKLALVPCENTPKYCEYFLPTQKQLQENQVRLKLIGIHQLLVYSIDVDLLEVNIDTIKKNTETLMPVRSLV